MSDADVERGRQIVASGKHSTIAWGEFEVGAVNGTNGHGAEELAEVDVESAPPKLEDLEQGFWDSRESLNIIYTAALSRMCSPWAVLAYCSARALTAVRPNWTLPPLVGGPGSLNWFVAIADRSGGGKTVAKSLARELLHGNIRERNLGSGEGMIGAFYKPAAKKDEEPEIHDANMFVADEVEAISALGSRTGQTTMSVLRSAFSGETLGFSYITKGRDVHLDAHKYRMTMVVCVQPGRSSVLLDDAYGGTPQRFMWFPANDDRICREKWNLWIPEISLPHMELYGRELVVPQEAADMILDARVANARGEMDALDGHALFCREKFAFSLTILDGRTEMTLEDWRLSGIAADVSDHTRRWVSKGLSTAKEHEAEERGRLMGVTYSASDEEKTYRADERGRRIARWALTKLREQGPLTNREISRAASRRDRAWLPGVLNELVDNGLAGKDEAGRWMSLIS